MVVKVPCLKRANRINYSAHLRKNFPLKTHHQLRNDLENISAYRPPEPGQEEEVVADDRKQNMFKYIRQVLKQIKLTSVFNKPNDKFMTSSSSS